MKYIKNVNALNAFKIANENKVVAFINEYDNFDEYNRYYAVIYNCINTMQLINDVYDIINDCIDTTTIECCCITINGIIYDFDTICKMHNNYKYCA